MYSTIAGRAARWLAAPLLAAALVLSGCSKDGATTGEAPAADTPAAEASGPIQFTSDYNAAIATAGREDKIVMLDVYTDWCTWCHKLDKEVYANDKVAAEVNKDFVALKVNPEESDANREFVDKYRIQGFPTILFLNGKGEEIHRLSGFKPVDGFMEELEVAREKARA